MKKSYNQNPFIEKQHKNGEREKKRYKHKITKT